MQYEGKEQISRKSVIASMQGRMNLGNCRLTIKNPDYQLGWAILAECRQIDTQKCNFHFMYIMKILPILPVLAVTKNIQPK